MSARGKELLKVNDSLLEQIERDKIYINKLVGITRHITAHETIGEKFVRVSDISKILIANERF